MLSLTPEVPTRNSAEPGSSEEPHTPDSLRKISVVLSDRLAVKEDKSWEQFTQDTFATSSKTEEYELAGIAALKSNTKNKLMPLMHKLLLRKRGIVETIIDQLKNISQIEHSKHRSPINFVVNLLGGLVAYCLRDKKPSLNLPGLNDKMTIFY